MSLVHIDKNKCDLSYSCIRVCPVNAIEVKVNNDYASILPDRCIGCGSCISVCPQKAIQYKDSKEPVRKLLKSDNEVLAIVGPSISGEFDDITDYRKFVQMIRKLGFKYVSEASFAADIIAAKYAELFKNFKGKYYISANCPAVVSYIEKFQPELLDNIAPLASPMIAAVKIAKKVYGNDIKTVYIGPCVAGKNEALRYKGNDRIDAVLTFVELRELFKEYDIHESHLEFSEFNPPLGYKGGLFPISNGILQAAGISEDLLHGEVITTEGKDNMLNAVSQFNLSIDSIKKHFNSYYCEGCIMGPGTSRNGKKYIRHSLVTKYVNKRIKEFNLETWKNNIKKFDALDYSATFKSDDQRIEMPSEEKIHEILKSIGKEDAIDDLGCNSCGYRSCRDFAVAVAKGLAKTDMCQTYTLKNRNEYIGALKATNEKLAQTQKALKESESLARKEKESAQEASDTINAMMQKLSAGVVIIDKELKVVHSNNSFIQMMGEETEAINEVIPGLKGADLKTLLPHDIYDLFNNVFSSREDIINKDIHLNDKLINLSIFAIKRDKMLGAVIRDMYAPEVRKEEVINRVTEVIDKNLEMVQKIGFLLGEGASETEKMLNSIIEFYRSEKKE